MTSTAYRLTLKDACAAFGVSYTSLYEAVKAGDVAAIKPFSQWLVAPDDVDAWLLEKDAARIEREAAQR